ncbi:response regulator [Paenibacillus ehimensis]|uniref:response regulator transcription factor n=1 Tax=Paenibacillus ehimensis TaxID=79264 RepID=UPI000FDBE2C6|nr:response regulator [Paenibacillus ehimensis]
MYKLVLIDDEPMIRQGLRKLIDWDAYGITICAEADNGMDGLRLCQELMPDGAIVDIRMPGMDGLGLIEAARSCGLATDFMILSGYSEFAYAQKATEFGVRCYLLKPIEQSELRSRVEGLCEAWKKRSKQQEQLQASRQAVAQHTLQKFMLDDLQDGAEMEQLTAHLQLPWSTYQVMLLDAERRELESGKLQRLIAQLQNRLGSQHRATVFPIRNYIGIVTESGAEELVNEELSAAEAQLGLQLVLSPGPEVHSFDKIPDSYQAAYERLRMKFLYERKGSMLVYSKRLTPEYKLDTPGFVLMNFADHASKAIIAHNRELLVKLLEETVHAMLQLGWYEKQIKASYAAMYTELIKLLSAADERVRSVVPAIHETVEALDSQTTLTAAVAFMERQLFALCEHWSKDKRNGGFAGILEYIATHYGSELNLELLAELFHYNSSYLGKLFKAQTGETFHSYLDRTRIEKAKQFLLDGYKVYEVAEMVGYASADYLHIKFKKVVGESPSTFRERWRGKPG